MCTHSIQEAPDNKKYVYIYIYIQIHIYYMYVQCVTMHIQAWSNVERTDAEQRHALQRQAFSNSNFQAAFLRA